MKLLIKHRYTHFDPATGQQLETKYGMTAEAAAGARMVNPKVIDDSRTEHYVSDSPADAGFPKHRAYI
jgi:hypothetical protein